MDIIRWYEIRYTYAAIHDIEEKYDYITFFNSASQRLTRKALLICAITI